MFKVLSLFAGVGGFDLGLERTGGFETVAFCEIDPFARRVLAKHWPEVPCYHDVRELTGERLAADGIAVDCLVAGFPCQDISEAGKGAGLGGERSGLFYEIVRLLGEFAAAGRPVRYAVLENVAALLGRGLGEVLRALAAIGLDAEWHCIPASAVGAPHRRDRIWIVAYPQCEPGGERHAGAAFIRRAGQAEQARVGGRTVADAPRQLLDWSRVAGTGGRTELADGGWWGAEPDVGRMAHGVPARTHRLRALGNAVVPQIPELIGRAILAAERQATILPERSAVSARAHLAGSVPQTPCAPGLFFHTPVHNASVTERRLENHG